MALSANLQRSTYTQDLAGETQYKRSVDQFNKANPNATISYEQSPNYNMPSAVKADGAGTYNAGAGGATFGTKPEAQQYSQTFGQVTGQQPTQPVQPQNQPVQPVQPIQAPLTAEQLQQRDRTNQTGLIEKGMQDLTKLGKDFGLETEPDTIQGMVDKFKAKQLQEKTYAEQQNARQAALDQAEAARFEAKAAGSQGATAAQFAQGREGAMAGSAPKLSSEFAVEMKKQIDENRIRLEAAQAQRDNMMLQLEQAQKSGQGALVEQISKQLGAAQEQIQRTKTNYLNALSQQNQDTMAREQQKATITNMGLSQASSLAEKGQFTAETAMGMAEQFDLPVDGLLGLINASQLKGDERVIAVMKAKQDLSDQINHIQTSAAQNAQYFQQQVSKINANPSLSPAQRQEEIGNLSMRLGMDDSSNPLTRMGLRLKEAELKIENAKLNGQPLGAQEWADYGAEWQQAVQFGEKPSGVVPIGGKYSAVNTDNGIQIDVQDGTKLNDPTTARDEGQCGAFVNDVFGKRIVGDTFEQKMGLTDPNITMPTPGMAFVQQTNTYTGHTGIIETVDYAKGLMSVVEANYPSGGKVGRRTVPISSASGFIPPPKGQAVTKGTASQVSGMTDESIAKSLYDATGKVATPKDIKNARLTGFVPGMSGEEKNKQYTTAERTTANQYRDEFNARPSVKNFLEIRDQYDDFSSIVNDKLGGAGDLALIYGFMKSLDPNSVVRENEFSAAANTGNIFAGALAGFNGKFRTGERLPEDVRKQFLDVVQTKLKNKAKSFEVDYNRYKDMANRSNLNPEDVVFDYRADIAGLNSATVQPKSKMIQNYLNDPNMSQENKDAFMQSLAQGGTEQQGEEALQKWYKDKYKDFQEVAGEEMVTNSLESTGEWGIPEDHAATKANIRFK